MKMHAYRVNDHIPNVYVQYEALSLFAFIGSYLEVCTTRGPLHHTNTPFLLWEGK